MTTQPGDGLRGRKRRRTRAQIAAATVQLASEHGLQGARLEDICAQAEVGRSTFFRYFDSKEAAFVEGVHGERLATLQQALAQRPRQEAPYLALREAAVTLFQDWRAHRERLLVEATIRQASPGVQAWAAAQSALWVGTIAEALTGRYTGPDAGARAYLLAAATVAAIELTGREWIAAGAQRSPLPALKKHLSQLENLTARSAPGLRR